MVYEYYGDHAYSRAERIDLKGPFTVQEGVPYSQSFQLLASSRYTLGASSHCGTVDHYGGHQVRPPNPINSGFSTDLSG